MAIFAMGFSLIVVPALGYTIELVIFIGSSKKVGWIKAFSIVTAMQYPSSIREREIEPQHSGYPMNP